MTDTGAVTENRSVPVDGSVGDDRALEHDRAMRAALGAAYDRARAGLARRIAVLEEATGAWIANRLDDAARVDAEREAHKLAGAAGTFGMPRISELASCLEELLATPRADPSRRRTGRELVAAMGRAFAEENAVADPAAAERGDARPAVLVAYGHPVAAGEVAGAIRGRGLRPVVVPELAAVPAMLRRHRVLAAVVAVPAGAGEAAALQLIHELSGTGAAGTLLVLAPDGGTAGRLAALAAGADVILDPTAAADEVADAVARALDNPATEPHRILAVDDDPDILTAIRTILEPEQIRLFPLDDPTRFVEALAAAEPDLVMLDADMAAVGGLELCRLIRADARWHGLPVLVLSASTDPELVRAALEAGADDYVVKPVLGPELVTRVRHRLERCRLQRLVADTDPLTGLANRRRLEEEVDRLLSFSRRLGQPLTLAVLHVEGVEDINRDYGLAVGDAVLRQIGTQLGRAFRADRVLARVSGAQFVLARLGVSPGATTSELAEVLDRIAEHGVELGGGASLRPTVRAGVAVYPEDGSDLQELYRCATQRDRAGTVA